MFIFEAKTWEVLHRFRTPSSRRRVASSEGTNHGESYMKKVLDRLCAFSLVVAFRPRLLALCIIEYQARRTKENA